MGVNNLPSVLNYIDPDVMLPDGTLYYHPFKVVPVINLIKQMDKNSDEYKYDDNEKPLELIWVAKTGTDYSAIVFKVFEDSKENYIPIGDLAILGPDDATNYLNKSYSKLLESLEKSSFVSYVLYVKNDQYSSKILTDNDFVHIDDDSGSGNYFDLSIWAAESRNVKGGEQHIDDYIILSDVVSKHYNNGLGLNSTPRRKIAAVNKNYFSKLDDYIWGKETGIADWNGIDNSEHISYSSPFANTFFADGISSDNGRYYLEDRGTKSKFSPALATGLAIGVGVVFFPLLPVIGLGLGLGLGLAKERDIVRVRNPLNFFDIRPSSVTRICCSGLNTHKLSEYCDGFNKQEVGKLQCISNMNDYCKGDNLKTDECLNWCKKDGIYCDTNFVNYCKNKDLTTVLPSDSPSPSSVSISYDTLKSNNIIDSYVNNKGSIRNTTEEKCKTLCSSKDDCDAAVFNSVNKTCDLYQDKGTVSLKSNTKISSFDNILFKNKKKEIDPNSDMKICACFKEPGFYNSYFNKVTGTYPEEIQDLITLTAGTRDKRCYYPECVNPANIKNKTLKQNPGQCGDRNVQVCFQDIKQKDVSLEESNVQSKQRLDCVNNIQKITGRNISPETIKALEKKTYSCSDNNTCILTNNGEYNTQEECENQCSGSGQTSNKDNTLIYAMIAGIIIFFLLIITILLIK